MTQRVKLSVLVPIYNVEKYLPACLDSLVNQTLEDIEIICINDGSTDNSLSIVQSFAKSDSRIVIIDKKNSGYGDSMNQGLARATGEYIGILESDDWVEPETYESLYLLAKRYNTDVTRANYFHYEDGKNQKNEVIDPDEVGYAVDPRVSKLMFYQAPAIWSAIYKHSFLKKNNIDFLPTPGASYQDTSFNFKVWTCAHRASFTTNAYLHYRLDNESSSVNSLGKVFCVCDEYTEIERFLHETGNFEELKDVFYPCKFAAYLWNINRLPRKFAVQFIRKIKPEFKGVKLEQSSFSKKHWSLLRKMIKYPPIVYLFFHRAPFIKVHLKEFISKTNKKLRPAYRRQIEIMNQTDTLAEQNQLLRDQVQILENEIVKLQKKGEKE